jgi:protein TonB
MHAYPGYPVGMSANDLFKRGYQRYVRWSALIALTLTILIFMLSPRYVPQPYRLRYEPLEIVQIEMPEVEIERPRPAIPPPRPLEPVEDDLVLEEPELADILMSWNDLQQRSLQPPQWQVPETFVASATDPQLVQLVPPDYPEMARLAHLEGTVVVKVLVGPNGMVTDVGIIEGVHPLLNKAAMEAAWRCRFTPGKQRERPVPVWMALPFRFRLR